MTRPDRYSFKQLDPREGMSPEEEEAYQCDVDAAAKLLSGIHKQDARGAPYDEFLSATTKPTDQEARAALARVLEHENVPRHILLDLAYLFNPDPKRHRRKLIFQDWLNQGRHDPGRDQWIEFCVEQEIVDWDEKEGPVRNSTTLQDAYQAVADQVGLSAEQVRRIYKGYAKRKLKKK
jgi:hypothetical protein